MIITVNQHCNLELQVPLERRIFWSVFVVFVLWSGTSISICIRRDDCDSRRNVLPPHEMDSTHSYNAGQTEVSARRVKAHDYLVLLTSGVLSRALHGVASAC
jgi:hypothetical protein